MKSVLCLLMLCAMTCAVELSPYAIASPLASAPIATSYSSISKIGNPWAAPIAIGTPIGYGSSLGTPISAPLAATPIAYKTSAVPIVSSLGYGANIAPLAYNTPIGTSYAYSNLAGGYLGSKYY
ncbi:hypothetical protein ACFFRR_002548 [Megaselia abdita]